MTENVFFAGALAAVALAFGGFAWLCARSFAEGADNLARTAGEEASRSFEEVFLFIPPKRMAEIGKCAACAAFFAFFIPLFSFTDAVSTTAGTALGALAALAAFSLPGKIAGSVKAKRRIKFDGQLVDALSSMSNALRAGFSINQAFESVAENSEKPISQEFGVVRQQMRVGMSFDDALSSLEKRVGSEDLSLVVSAIEIARRTGGNLTEIFDRISETIRARTRIERRVRTLTAQGRLQGLIVSAMPFILGAAMTVLKPDLMIPFLLSLKGAVCVACAGMLVACGWLAIRKIIRIDV